MNRRIVKVDKTGMSDVTYDYYLNEAWQTLEVRKDADTDPYEHFIWHPYYIDALLLRDYDADTDGAATRYYYTHDANFNVTAVTGNTGTVVERYNYTPYGQLIVLDANFATDGDGASDIANTTTYTGREFDPETGLYYYRNRYYHAEAGQFVTRDPIGYEGGIHLYAYVAGRPTVETDPQGQDCPGCDIPEWALGNQANDSACVRACCAQHDKCYSDHKCTYASWCWNAAGVIGGAVGGGVVGGVVGGIRGGVLGGQIAGLLSKCARCNNEAVVCIVACGVGNHMQGKPEYFCAGGPKAGQFITIGKVPPNDYPDIDAAKKACCT
jgi:RHS repeat-associated protein